MKIICVGRNYEDHAKELKNEIPTEPVIFMKSRNALLLPGKPLFYPEFTDKLQYECEIVIRIGKNGRHIDEGNARGYYNEITLGIDFTARDLQEKLKKKGLPWELAKSFDGSAALGTFLKLDARTDVQALLFELRQNGATVQEGNSADMIFTIDEIIAYVSTYFTVNIGDVIFTGTPAGVGNVNVYDRLEGYLSGERLLDVAIR